MNDLHPVDHIKHTSLASMFAAAILLSTITFGNGFNAKNLSAESTFGGLEKEFTSLTETPDEQLDISAGIKQKKKVTLIAVKNNDDEPIFAFKIKIVDGNIKFIKAKSWNRDRIDQSTVLAHTNDRPITKGKSMIIILITDNRSASYEWRAFDKNNIEIAKGELVSVSEVAVRPRLDQLNFTVSEYPLPDDTSSPLFPLYDKNRNVIWISDSSKPRIWAN